MNRIKKYIISQFGKPRGFVGRVVGRILENKNEERTKWAVTKLNAKPDDRILEVGFGPGLSIELLTKQIDSGFIAGIDHSDEMVKYANRKNSQKIKEGKVKLGVGSSDAIKYEDNFFTKAFCINVNTFWSNPKNHMNELKRVLKKGGRLSIYLQPKMVKSFQETKAKVDEIINLYR
ncbi:MAG: class I SAM-dependent methyltransferase [Ignavibacteria bacterium]|jgi:ubiquinone/menaquinone biosynthesis C-methylase UbiE